MPPIFNVDTNFETTTRINNDDYDSNDINDDLIQADLAQVAFWYMIILVGMLLTWLVVFSCLRIITLGQKTRSTPERRMYVGSRARPSSFGQPEPTIYVSPANLPPPPKYEAMAPPSYEEVVGIHYPQFQQPITTPIITALSQSTNSRSNVITNSSSGTNVTDSNINVMTSVNSVNNVTDTCNNEPVTVITVSSNERRTSVTVASS